MVSDNQYLTIQQYEPTIWKDDVIDSYTISIIAPLLRRVITHGTGKEVYISGINISGKTGTAEIGTDKSREIAWFIGYTRNTDNPLLVCVTIEVPAKQGEARFIIARELFQ